MKQLFTYRLSRWMRMYLISLALLGCSVIYTQHLFATITGAGTSADPYTINSSADLDRFGTYVINGNTAYNNSSNIDGSWYSGGLIGAAFFNTTIDNVHIPTSYITDFYGKCWGGLTGQIGMLQGEVTNITSLFCSRRRIHTIKCNIYRAAWLTLLTPSITNTVRLILQTVWQILIFHLVQTQIVLLLAVYWDARFFPPQ
jgi:hypothetical protein